MSARTYCQHCGAETNRMDRAHLSVRLTSTERWHCVEMVPVISDSVRDGGDDLDRIGDALALSRHIPRPGQVGCIDSLEVA